MKRHKSRAEKEKIKKITIRRSPQKTTFVVAYADGHKAETTYVEIQGGATLYLDVKTKEPVIKTEANVNLGQTPVACPVCGGGMNDNHAHA